MNRSTVAVLLLLLMLLATAGNAGFGALEIREGGSTTTPTTGNVVIYAKANGLLYSKDDAGTESALAGGGFTIGLPPSSGVASVSSTTFPALSVNATSGIPQLAFDGVTQEAIQWHNITLPATYTATDSLTIEAVVSCADVSQSTRWGIRVATVEAALISTAPGTLLDAQQVVDATTSGTANTATTIIWTLANADIDAAAAGDLIMIQLDRDAASVEDGSVKDVFIHTLRISQ